MNSDTLAQTYARHGNKWFYVSTVNRDSSAVEFNSRYAETLVWEYDPTTKFLGKLIGQFEDTENEITRHQDVVVKLHKTGKTQEDDEL